MRDELFIYIKIKNTLSYLCLNAHTRSTGYCARHIGKALKVGGFGDFWGHAETYGQNLINAGFRKIKPKPSPDYKPIIGDIAVIQPYSGKEHGHIQMYDGITWISDFIQSPNFWPGPKYRLYKPKYEVYRYFIITT